MPTVVAETRESAPTVHTSVTVIKFGSCDDTMNGLVACPELMERFVIMKILPYPVGLARL